MKTYNLEQRTINFSKEIIEFCKVFPKNITTIPLIKQVIRSATSIGANYCEANGASSKKDFASKIFICKKEAKETKYWLDLLSNSEENLNLKDMCDKLSKETHELLLIFSKIASSSK